MGGKAFKPAHRSAGAFDVEEDELDDGPGCCGCFAKGVSTLLASPCKELQLDSQISSARQTWQSDCMRYDIPNSKIWESVIIQCYTIRLMDLSCLFWTSCKVNQGMQDTAQLTLERSPVTWAKPSQQCWSVHIPPLWCPYACSAQDALSHSYQGLHACPGSCLELTLLV